MFGELEYIFGCFKLIFITMLIVVRTPTWLAVTP
jgi:amino acid permease